MNDRLAEVESRLAAVERRLLALEGRGRARETAAEPPPPVRVRDGAFANAATWLGRVLLIFGGAYLLRAITDYGFLPTRAGIPMGAAYALLWLYMAWRAAAHERSGAQVYGAVSVLMTLPILVEAVTRFELLSGAQSAAALALCCALYLLVAVGRELRLVAWLIVAGGLLTAAVLSKASGAAVPFAVFTLLLGLASLWTVYLRRWRGLQWLGAAGANLGVVAVSALSNNAHWSIAPPTAYALVLVLWCAYLASFALRSHVQGHAPGVFEAVQAMVSSAIAFGVALYMVQAGHAGGSGFGLLALALGLGSYALALTPRTRTARGPGYYFYGTLGLALLIGGSALLLSPARAALGWSLLAIVLAWSSGRYQRVSLSLHCTFLLLAAAVGSGVLATGVIALAGDPAGDWPRLAGTQVLVASAMVACLFIPVDQRSERWGAAAILPQLVVLLLAGWSVGGLIVAALAPPLARVPGAAADPGTLAALRTAVLALAAVTLAASSRYRRWPEARWLAYPVLVAVGAKLLVEDFPSGRPLTLFIALALVGGALILVSRLLPRRARRTEETATAPSMT